MLVHRTVTPSIKFAGTQLYMWVERGTVRVKCLAQEHNAMSPARSQTRTAQSGVEGTKHEASPPPYLLLLMFYCTGQNENKWVGHNQSVKLSKIFAHQAWKTVFDPSFKNWEETCRGLFLTNFEPVQGVWKCGQTQSWVFDMSFQSVLLNWQENGELNL